MFGRLKLGVATAAAVIGLLIAAQLADASRIELNRTIWTMTFSELRFQGGVIELVCPVTIEGTFHGRTIVKVSGMLIGVVTRAISSPTRCRGGTATFLNGTENATNTLPWHIRYDAYTGTLPAFSGMWMMIVGLSVRLRDVVAGETYDCLYLSEVRWPAYLFLSRDTTTGDITEVIPSLGVEFTEWLRNINMNISCPSFINWGGSNSNGRMLIFRETRPINLRLI